MFGLSETHDGRPNMSLKRHRPPVREPLDLHLWRIVVRTRTLECPAAHQGRCRRGSGTIAGLGLLQGRRDSRETYCARPKVGNLVVGPRIVSLLILLVSVVPFVLFVSPAVEGRCQGRLDVTTVSLQARSVVSLGHVSTAHEGCWRWARRETVLTAPGPLPAACCFPARSRLESRVCRRAVCPPAAACGSADQSRPQ